MTSYHVSLSLQIATQSGEVREPARNDVGDLWFAPAQGVIPIDEHPRDRSRYGRRLSFELFRRHEGIAPTRDKEARQMEVGKVFDPKAIGAPGGMQG